MNQPRQFSSLFAFQAVLNPYVWFMVAILLMPVFLMHQFLAGGHENLELLLHVPNLFFVAILGLWMLAPEMGRAQWGATSSLPSSEFLLTLALDRRVLYRSRVALFYLAILISPVLVLVLALLSPNLTATEYEQQVRLACLHAVPGSALLRDPSGSTSPLLALPGGNVLIAEWHLWMYVAAALLSQLAFTFLFPLKNRLALFYVLFLGIPFVPLVITLTRGSQPFFSPTERLFFFFTGHQAVFWLASEVLFIAGQLWCEQRFVRQEY